MLCKAIYKRRRDNSYQIILNHLIVPLFRGNILVTVKGNRFFDSAPDHGLEIILHIFSVQDSPSLRVYDFPLLIHNVVILQDVFADFEVSCFHLLLCSFDRRRKHFIFNGVVFVDFQRIHDALDPFGAEEPHQIVFQGNIKAGHSGISLPAGTAAELVVDPS